jgi:uroporphyrinogen decarboxylase
MNSRERTIRAIEMRTPDRLPIKHFTLPGAFLKYGKKLEEFYKKYPEDILYPSYGSSTMASEEYGSEIGIESKDRWGCVWVRLTDDFKGQIVDHPLADWKTLVKYRFPKALGWPEFTIVENAIKKDRGEHYVLVDGDTLWQRMFYLRGMEKLFVDIMMGREEVYKLRDRILEYILKRVEKWVNLGVDGIQFRDDWGTQYQLMIRPSIWREIFKPAYREMFKAVHKEKTHVHFHSDGMIQPIVQDLMEIGVDVLNLQLSTMNILELGRKFGGHVCFLGGLDRQRILPKGSAEDVAAHAVEVVEAFGSFGGGYIGAGEVGADVPLENIEAMLRTFWAYRY